MLLKGEQTQKGIPYIYLGTDKYLSIHEVRPWPGKHVSLGQFGTTRKLNLIDFASKDEHKIYIDFENGKFLADDSIESLWLEFNKSFSQPVNPSDNSCDYVVTQVIAELVKKNGYGGLIYNSSYSTNEVAGYNIVILNQENFELLTWIL